MMSLSLHSFLKVHQPEHRLKNVSIFTLGPCLFICSLRCSSVWQLSRLSSAPSQVPACHPLSHLVHQRFWRLFETNVYCMLLFDLSQNERCYDIALKKIVCWLPERALKIKCMFQLVSCAIWGKMEAGIFTQQWLEARAAVKLQKLQILRGVVSSSDTCTLTHVCTLPLHCRSVYGTKQTEAPSTAHCALYSYLIPLDNILKNLCRTI